MFKTEEIQIRGKKYLKKNTIFEKSKNEIAYLFFIQSLKINRIDELFSL
jgi:hypothetical protein